MFGLPSSCTSWSSQEIFFVVHTNSMTNKIEVAEFNIMNKFSSLNILYNSAASSKPDTNFLEFIQNHISRQ